MAKSGIFLRADSGGVTLQLVNLRPQGGFGRSRRGKTRIESGFLLLQRRRRRREAGIFREEPGVLRLGLVGGGLGGVQPGLQCCLLRRIESGRARGRRFGGRFSSGQRRRHARGFGGGSRQPLIKRLTLRHRGLGRGYQAGVFRQQARILGAGSFKGRDEL